MKKNLIITKSSLLKDDRFLGMSETARKEYLIPLKHCNPEGVFNSTILRILGITDEIVKELVKNDYIIYCNANNSYYVTNWGLHHKQIEINVFKNCNKSIKYHIYNNDKFIFDAIRKTNNVSNNKNGYGFLPKKLLEKKKRCIHKTCKKRQVKIMAVPQKCELLKRNIWTKRECSLYFGLSSSSMRKLYKLMIEYPSSPRCVYRDEVLRLVKTTAERELSICEEARSLLYIFA